MLRLYVRFRSYIINHPFLPYFLSHGAVHIIGAILTIGLCIYFYNDSFAYEPVYKQINLKLTDTFFDSAKYIEIDFESSADSAEDSLYIYAVYGQADTSAMTKMEPFRLDPDRITFIGYDHYYGRPFYARTTYNPYIEDSPETYRVSKLKLETLNSKISFQHSPNYDPSICHVDSLSSGYIHQSTYCDYRKVSHKGKHKYTRSNLFNEISLKGNFIKDSKDNPYYHFSLIINDRLKDHHKAEGQVTFSFTDKETNGKMIQMNFLQCMPSKYYYNPVDGLTFDIQDVLENGGIYFLAEDMVKKDKAERKIFMSSVLLGACLAFLIDIIINLVIKWRDLAKRKKRLQRP